MSWQYSKHYTRDEARALLPQVREWLSNLARARQQLAKSDAQNSSRLAEGQDLGGEPVTRWVRLLAEMKDLIMEFTRRQIELKDLDRGLIDFPAFLGGKEVFLCWEKDEEDIDYWHDLNAGYAGRERIEEG